MPVTIVPRPVRLVIQCFTTRTTWTSRTSRGLVYTPEVSLMMCSSPTVRLVKRCFTTRTGRRTRTGRVQPFTGRICSIVMDMDALLMGQLMNTV